MALGTPRTPGKGSGEPEMRTGAGRIRGLRDIQTLGTLRRPAPASVGLQRVGLRLGLGLGAGKPRSPPGTESPGRPRAWVFVKRPRFARHQGTLLVDRVDEPEVDVFDEGQCLLVLAERPGAREQDVEVHVNGDVLLLSTRPGPDGRRRYHRELLLPFPVESAGVRRTFRNGVLELELQRGSPPAKAGRRQRT